MKNCTDSEDFAVWTGVIGNVVSILVQTYLWYTTKDCTNQCFKKQPAPPTVPNLEALHLQNFLTQLQGSVKNIRSKDCSCNTSGSTISNTIVPAPKLKTKSTQSNTDDKKFMTKCGKPNYMHEFAQTTLVACPVAGYTYTEEPMRSYQTEKYKNESQQILVASKAPFYAAPPPTCMTTIKLATYLDADCELCEHREPGSCKDCHIDLTDPAILRAAKDMIPLDYVPKELKDKDNSKKSLKVKIAPANLGDQTFEMVNVRHYEPKMVDESVMAEGLVECESCIPCRQSNESLSSYGSCVGCCVLSDDTGEDVGKRVCKGRDQKTAISDSALPSPNKQKTKCLQTEEDAHRGEEEDDVVEEYIYLKCTSRGTQQDDNVFIYDKMISSRIKTCVPRTIVNSARSRIPQSSVEYIYYKDSNGKTYYKYRPRDVRSVDNNKIMRREKVKKQLRQYMTSWMGAGLDGAEDDDDDAEDVFDDCCVEGNTTGELNMSPSDPVQVSSTLLGCKEKSNEY